MDHLRMSYTEPKPKPTDKTINKDEPQPEQAIKQEHRSRHRVPTGTDNRPRGVVRTRTGDDDSVVQT